MSVEEQSRVARLKVLEDLLKKEVICRQSTLVTRLNAQGFEATQSSVSRDLASLGVLKQAGRYVLPSKMKGFAGIVSIVSAGPYMLVARTPVGAAQMVAYRIDEAEFEGIAGTVAGDDTIFIALRGAEYQKAIMEALQEED
ncbi:MAG: arginine repressor [Armatimonadetes bacterium]|nr:arginine repressor [Armatimonadota bacterium]